MKTENTTDQNASKWWQFKLNIRNKLVLAMVSLGVVALGITISASYYNTSKALQSQAFAQLRSVGAIKADNIESYFQSLRSELASQAESVTVRNALRDLSAARETLLAEISANGTKLDDAAFAKIKGDVRGYYQDVLVANLKKVHPGFTGTAESFMHKNKPPGVKPAKVKGSKKK